MTGLAKIITVLKLALLQYQATADKSANLSLVSELIARASSEGAKLIALPETFNYRGLADSECDQAEAASDSASLKFIQDLALKYGVSIMAGSHLVYDPVIASDAKQLTQSVILSAAKDPITSSTVKPYNRAHYINAGGTLVASYSKIHLFDVNLESRTAQESASRCAGDISQLEVFSDTAGGEQINMALSICYDLRFPELYRHYMFNCSKRPDIIFVPSAFNMETGKAHWESLLRARAIENSVYIVAPNQIGTSDSGFECYGNSMVVDPWGRVVARASTDRDEILFAEIDLALLQVVRQRLPLDNKRFK